MSTMTDWPVTALDPVRRLRVLAVALNAALYADAHVDLPFADVWAAASDLLPGPFGHREGFDIVLRPGWCLLQSGHVLGGMAAVPEGTGTRFAVLGGLRRHSAGVQVHAPGNA
ncbi:hypothetical protein [Streptomyces sp. NPDC016845]|uniref:hypothetical protein n=1 Tax=Streptomyces sp. NPDC016845 TaxID=3364972 RepID=UPI00379A0935